MKGLCGVAILVASVGMGLWAEVSNVNDLFFPLNPGDTWVYDTLNKKAKEHFDMKVAVEGPWEEKGQSGIILTQRDQRGKMREFLLRNEKGVFIYKLGLSKGYTPEVDTDFTPPVPRVIYPMAPG